MTSAKASADQSASSQAKLKAWSSSSGRTKATVDSRRLGPGLGDGHPVGAGLVEDAVPGAVDVVDLGLVPHRLVLELARDHRVVGVDLAGRGALALGHDLVAQRLLLEEAVRHVDAEPVDPAVEPEAQDVLEHRRHLGVAPVEVGLAGVEEVEVPLAVLDLGPRRTAEDRAPVVGGTVGAVAEEVAGALRAARPGRQRRLEPLVLVGGVVGHQVDDDAQVQLVGPGHQGVGVGQRAEQRVDVAVVGDVVAVVVLRRGVERRDPQRVDTQLGEVGEPRRDAGEVADAVAVAVGEAADVDLVDDGVPPPVVAGNLIVQIGHGEYPLNRAGGVVKPARQRWGT